MLTVAPETQDFSSSRLQRATDAMQGYIDRDQFAGMISLVARRGQIVHLQTYGQMDREAAKPMRVDAIFRIYSMSKPITSTAVMMLFEEGRFRLNDPISRYIPAFKEVKVYQPRGADFDLVAPKREITIRDLLTHTSGLSYGFEEKSYVDDLYRTKVWAKMDEDPEVDLAQMVDLISKLPLANHPGVVFRYSMATDVLGYLVQVISGKSFDVFLKERIFEPLGMPDTAFDVPAAKLDRFTAVYGPADEGGLKLLEGPVDSKYTHPAKVLSGGGGLVSTMADYQRFAQMLLNRGQFGSERLLGPKTVDLMMMNHIVNDGRLPDEPYRGFGLGGSVVRDVAGSQELGSVGNWGWGGAAHTWFTIDPQEQLLLILMLQYMPAFVIPVEHDFQNMVYQAMLE
jgi:CubicO group peptidase (beta-lactamase class C family)